MLEQGADIKSNDLETYWLYKNQEDKRKKRKTFVVACRCGNIKMLYVKDCVRCHNCGRGHDYPSVLKAHEEVKKLANLNDGKKSKVRQLRSKRPENAVRINLKTGQTEKISFESWAKRALNRPTIEYECPKCKKKFLWTGQHFVSGISPPLLEVNGERQCFECLRNLFKVEE